MLKARFAPQARRIRRAGGETFRVRKEEQVTSVESSRAMRRTTLIEECMVRAK